MSIAIYPALGNTTGLGHLKRCIAIGKSLQKLSFNVKFLVDDALFSDLIQKEGFSYLNISETSSKRFDLIIVDRYDITNQLLRALKNKCNLLARNDDRYPEMFVDLISDIVLNGNPYGTIEEYIGLVKKGCKIIAGRDFIPMDEVFCRLRNDFYIKDKLSNLVITFGGSNNMDYPTAIIQEILKYELFDKIFVLNGESLKDKFGYNLDTRIKLLPFQERVDEIFSVADLVICSASTTCWQLSTIGIPFIAFQTASNQAKGFQYINYKRIGIALKIEEINNGTLIKTIRNLDKSSRLTLYQTSRNDIPCDGAKRITDQLVKLMN